VRHTITLTTAAFARVLVSNLKAEAGVPQNIGIRRKRDSDIQFGFQKVLQCLRLTFFFDELHSTTKPITVRAVPKTAHAVDPGSCFLRK
jgi:hypothetical protein